MNNIYKNRLIYNGLNLDYPIKCKQSYESQTNETICKITNDFINKYKNSFKNKTFVLIYNDDIYSLIAYQILKNIQGIYFFNLKIIGKRKNTKQDVNKKDFLNSFQKRRLSKKNLIYISCFNPIYKVKNSIISFKELGDTYNIIEKFTPLQFQIMADFYSIKNIELLKEFETDSFLNFKDFTLNRGIIFKKDLNIFTNNYFEEVIKKIEKVDLIYLEGNENDFKIFDIIRKTADKSIYFYYFKEENRNFLTNNLNHFINPANIICEENLFPFVFMKILPYNFIGNWNEEEKELINDFILNKVK